ncbi:SDR family oxidoreductase [Alterinioella nitratireducens]|uniref:SDR family oxidoreductase n=1 Tax=Alterinioella nitratireducens TaxID=2735915 RepID=UPI001552C436|nr:SDR family oxidoreductase [Alterinioella nitratireducens]
MKGLSGARVLITAGAAGIGRVMAERFQAEGARVAVCDVDAGAVADMQAANPGILARVADVTEEGAVDAFFDEVLAAFGGLDVVAANAGIGGPAGAIEDLTLGGWKDTLAVNLDGAFLTCRRAAPVLKAQGAGLLLLTSSTAGLFGYPYRAPYAVAKWGIIGLMKTLAMELGPSGVRVNALCPGAVSGPRMDRVVANEARARGVGEDEIRQLYVKGVSMKTWVEADDIADMALCLASDMGRRVSGQAMAVDGHTETIGD